MYDLELGAMYNSPVFCGVCDPEERNNEDLLIKGTYFLSTKSLGSHNIVLGYDDFSGTRKSNNYQSGSSYWFYSADVIIKGQDVFPHRRRELLPRVLADPDPLASAPTSGRYSVLPERHLAPQQQLLLQPRRPVRQEQREGLHGRHDGRRRGLQPAPRRDLRPVRGRQAPPQRELRPLRRRHPGEPGRRGLGRRQPGLLPVLLRRARDQRRPERRQPRPRPRPSSPSSAGTASPGPTSSRRRSPRTTSPSPASTSSSRARSSRPTSTSSRSASPAPSAPAATSASTASTGPGPTSTPSCAT